MCGRLVLLEANGSGNFAQLNNNNESIRRGLARAPNASKRVQARARARARLLAVAAKLPNGRELRRATRHAMARAFATAAATAVATQKRIREPFGLDTADRSVSRVRPATCTRASRTTTRVAVALQRQLMRRFVVGVEGNMRAKIAKQIV